jgi:hypothetical protein
MKPWQFRRFLAEFLHFRQNRPPGPLQSVFAIAASKVAISPNKIDFSGPGGRKIGLPLGRSLLQMPKTLERRLSILVHRLLGK